MLRSELQIRNDIFSDKVPRLPIRNGLGEGLLYLGKEQNRVVVLSADLSESTRVLAFKQAYPDRFFEVGVAEQNLATLAAGFAVSGFVPFIASYAAFSPGRNYEQIRTTIAYNNANVKIIGAHAGLSVGPDGATHQATEDIAIMRVMPNMRVFVPCDAEEARKVVVAAASIDGPVYIRLAREESPLFTSPGTPFVPGRPYVVFEGKSPRVSIFACGLMLYEALQAARMLGDRGVSVCVANMHTIKPLDRDFVLRNVKRTRAVVVCEEHQIAGGLGGALAEFLSENMPVPIEYVGLADTFGESGSATLLFQKYGLHAHAIVEKALKVLKRSS